MSRLDYLTIIIVAICIFLLVFVVYRVVNLDGTVPRSALPDTAQVVSPPNLGIELDSLKIEGQEDPLPEEDMFGVEEARVRDTQAPRTDRRYSNPTGDYMVVAGTFADRANAQEAADRIKKLGYSTVEIGRFNRGKFTAVIVARFDEQQDAAALVRDLKEQHQVDSYVQKKRQD